MAPTLTDNDTFHTDHTALDKKEEGNQPSSFSFDANETFACLLLDLA